MTKVILGPWLVHGPRMTQLGLEKERQFAQGSEQGDVLGALHQAAQHRYDQGPCPPCCTLTAPCEIG